MTARVRLVVMATVAALAAVAILRGDRFAGPVVVRISEGHGVHVGDLAVLAVAVAAIAVVAQVRP